MLLSRENINPFNCIMYGEFVQKNIFLFACNIIKRNIKPSYYINFLFFL